MLHYFAMKSELIVSTQFFRDTLERNLHMKRRLSVASDMSNYALEDLRLARSSTHIGIKVLEFDLFAPEVVSEAAKGATLVLFPILIFKLVPFDSLSHLRRVLF